MPMPSRRRQTVPVSRRRRSRPRGRRRRRRRRAQHEPAMRRKLEPGTSTCRPGRRRSPSARPRASSRRLRRLPQRDIDRWDLLVRRTAARLRRVRLGGTGGTGTAVRAGDPVRAVRSRSCRAAQRAGGPDRAGRPERSCARSVGPRRPARATPMVGRRALVSSCRLASTSTPSPPRSGATTSCSCACTTSSPTRSRHAEPLVAHVVPASRREQLYLAADVLVTDSSAAMFDLRGDRPPMAFLTSTSPDFQRRVRGALRARRRGSRARSVATTAELIEV